MLKPEPYCMICGTPAEKWEDGQFYCVDPECSNCKPVENENERLVRQSNGMATDVEPSAAGDFTLRCVEAVAWDLVAKLIIYHEDANEFPDHEEIAEMLRQSILNTRIPPENGKPVGLQDLVGLVKLPEGEDSVSYVRKLRDADET